MNRGKLLILAAILLAAPLAGCGGSGGSPATSAQAVEKSWVRSHLADVYLWNTEIVDVPPADCPLAPDYFSALLVRPKDRFSFSMPQAAADSMLQEGEETGFGVKWGWAAPGELFAYYVDPNSPAASAIPRGAEITAINGQPVTGISNSALIEALYPERDGVAASMAVRRPGTSTTQATTLVSATFATTTVSQPAILPLANGDKAGYLLFNEHLLTSEQKLVNAMAFFKQQGVTEVVLDLRYNGGGYLLIAEEVASMLGGAAVQGKVFEKLLFNGNHPEKTNDPRSTYLFSPVDRMGALLPQLGLKRVFILTGASTCSASESIINGLSPFMPVVRIGWTTCGKPYGFSQTNNAQQAYFAVQFEGVNASGLDDFKSGFAPTCQVADDLKYPLGDAREARLSAALYFMDNNACPVAVNVSLPKPVESAEAAFSGEVQLLGRKPSLKIVP